MPDPASITLSNGAVVKVGDVVPLFLGAAVVVEIDNDPDTMLFCAYVCKASRLVWYEADGTHSPYKSRINIDLDKLAALAQPARAQAGVAELVAQWRAEADLRAGCAKGDVDKLFAAKLKREAATLRKCSDALAALNGGE